MSTKQTSQRLSHQKSIFRLEAKLEALEKNVSIATLKSILDLLSEYWCKFQTVQLSIEEKTSDENIEYELKFMETTESSYLRTKSKLTAMVDAIRITEEHQHEDCDNRSNVKLPKLEVPKFDGSFNNWSSFRDMFTTMVRNQTYLTDGQTLQYLKPNLMNEAADIVSEYQVTDANFDAAWEALEHRYDNKRLQIKAHLDTLFDQEIMSSESAEALRLLLRTTQKCLQALESLGGLVNSWDWLLIQLVGMRLHPKTKRYWELSHNSKEMPTWKQMVTALEIRCNALESDQSSWQFGSGNF